MYMMVCDSIFTCMSSAGSAGWSTGSAGPGSASESTSEAACAGCSSQTQ